MQALEEISSLAHGDVFGCSIAVTCSKCGVRFAVFLPAKDDPDNANYMASVRAMIENDCKASKHSVVYKFETTP